MSRTFSKTFQLGFLLFTLILTGCSGMGTEDCPTFDILGDRTNDKIVGQDYTFTVSVVDPANVRDLVLWQVVEEPVNAEYALTISQDDADTVIINAGTPGTYTLQAELETKNSVCHALPQLTKEFSIVFVNP